jgi:hypothetical protein
MREGSPGRGVIHTKNIDGIKETDLSISRKRDRKLHLIFRCSALTVNTSPLQK